MKLINNLSNLIEEELEDAKNYAECALRYQDENRALANTFHTISGEEMRHVDMLHEQVVRIIEAHRKEHGEPPADMKIIYDYLHKKHIQKAAEVNVMLDMYKG